MSTAPVQVMPVADLTRLVEAFRQMGETMRRAFSGMHGDPERALNRRLLFAATVHLDRALRDARKTLDPEALREELADLPMETRMYVSGRLDPAWTEVDLTWNAASLVRQGRGREAQALLQGWADRG